MWKDDNSAAAKLPPCYLDLWVFCCALSALSWCQSGKAVWVRDGVIKALQWPSAHKVCVVMVGNGAFYGPNSAVMTSGPFLKQPECWATKREQPWFSDWLLASSLQKANPQVVLKWYRIFAYKNKLHHPTDHSVVNIHFSEIVTDNSLFPPSFPVIFHCHLALVSKNLMITLNVQEWSSQKFDLW